MKINSNLYFSQFALYLFDFTVKLKSPWKKPELEYKMTGLMSQSLSACLESVVGISCPLEQFRPFTQKTNKKHFTSVTYTHVCFHEYIISQSGSVTHTTAQEDGSLLSKGTISVLLYNIRIINRWSRGK